MIPSRQPERRPVLTSPFWQAIQAIYDEAAALEPLPRRSRELFEGYIARRRWDENFDVAVLRRSLPKEFELIAERLGPSEVEIVNFIARYERNQILNIFGSRGAGKTTLIHFVEECFHRALGDQAPMFLVLDGNAIPTDTPIEAVRSRLASILRDECERATGRPISVGGDQDINVTPSQDLIGFCVRLVSTVKGKAPKERVVLVVDNLDHHRSEAVGAILQMAKSIYLGIRVPTVVCLRPGARSAAFNRGDARAFFSFYIHIHAPDTHAWLNRLVGRCREAAERQHGKGPFNVVHDFAIDHRTVEVALRRFVDLLSSQVGKGKRGRDKVVEILQDASADDMRLLEKLVRRILSNRNLPFVHLLRGEPKAVFHPLPMLIEGPWPLFRHQADVPNLLWFEAGGYQHRGTLLVLHRILCVLRDEDQMPVRVLRELMECMGFETAVWIGALRMLHSAGLVSASDGEVLEVDAKLPEGWMLTESGRFYFDKMLHYIDYHACVVADIPLKHTHWPAEVDVPFHRRLQSVAELAEAVRQEEAGQLRRIQRLPDHRVRARVATTMLQGGLLTKCIIDALEEAAEQAEGASDPSRARDIARQISEGQLKQLRSWWNFSIQRLTELVHATSTAQPSGEELAHFELPQATIRVSRSGPHSLAPTTLHVHLADPVAAVAVVLHFADGSSQHSEITLASPRGNRAPEDRKQHSVKVRVSSPERHDRVGVEAVPFRTSSPRSGLLSATVEADYVRLMLQFLHGDGTGEVAELGRVKRAVLRELASTLIGSVSSLVVQGQRDESSILEEIRISGTRLGEVALSSRGRDVLASHLHALEEVLLCTSDVSVPWEWMAVPPVGAEMFPLIGEAWRISRWVSAEGLGGAYLRSLPDPPSWNNILSLGVGDHQGWERIPPASWSDVRSQLQRLSAPPLLHLVGHTDAPGAPLNLGEEIWERGLVVSRDAASAFPVRVSGLVVSTCRGALAPLRANVALTMAQRASCPLWTPLVNIRSSDAVFVENFLRGQPPGGGELWSMRRESSELAQLMSAVFVRYAVPIAPIEDQGE
ncbi:MAG: hypothetical protein ACOZNI_20100 [Myxococcota bacterium]